MGIIMTAERPNVTGAPLMRGARRRADTHSPDLPARCPTGIEGKIGATCDAHHHQAVRWFCLAC